LEDFNMELVDRMLSGSQQSLSRLITLVENDSEVVPEIMSDIFPHVGQAYILGITGPPGGGKSTLVDRLTAVARSKGLSVGIVAVDPTSPFSGGALLGDRIRMQHHYLDSEVFIRSMATRGSHGGLPRAARGVIKLLDAFGKDIIMVETVGVGQTELDVMETADAVIVVLSPEAGDTIQTMKAGLMEIADIFVVNKADREGANQLLIALRASLHLSSTEPGWQVPVLATQAVSNVGIDELYREVERYRGFLETNGRLSQRRRKQRKEEFLQIIKLRVTQWLLMLTEKEAAVSAYMKRVENGELDPYSAATEILSNKTFITNWLSEL
jgi:LAO/AO transport system kinase